MADRKIPPDPGGYLEEFHFGGPTVWHSYNGKNLKGDAAIEKFNQYASSPIPLKGKKQSGQGK